MNLNRGHVGGHLADLCPTILPGVHQYLKAQRRVHLEDFDRIRGGVSGGPQDSKEEQKGLNGLGPLGRKFYWKKMSCRFSCN